VADDEDLVDALHGYLLGVAGSPEREPRSVPGDDPSKTGVGWLAGCRKPSKGVETSTPGSVTPG
jgi:hypothetical protein